MRHRIAARFAGIPRVLLAAWAATCLAPAVTPGASGAGKAADRALVEAGKRSAAYVRVETEKGAVSGSSFCIDSTGLFVTNHHVIEKATKKDKISVVLSPGTPAERKLAATVVKSDPAADVAILRVDRPGRLEAVDLAAPAALDGLAETAPVLAIGYPFGELLATGKGGARAAAAPEASVSPGRITALRHERGQLAVIQFDGSVNPGNSGGPLLDDRGNVIGIVTAIVPNKQINFAVPVSQVRALLVSAGIVLTPRTLTDPAAAAAAVDGLAGAPPPNRAKVPGAAEQKAALPLVRELFAKQFADKTPRGRWLLVSALLDRADKTADDPLGRYVMLTEAREAAVAGGELSGGMLAAVALADLYEHDVLALGADVLTRTAPRLTQAQDAAVGAAVGLPFVEAMARREAYGEARRLIPLVRSLAANSRNATVVNFVRDRLARVEAGALESERSLAAAEKLKIDPGDAASNLAVGRYLCLWRGEWAKGLPLLVKGGDAALRAAAAKDLSNPADAAEQFAVGEMWRDLSAKEVGPSKPALLGRAGTWYRKAEAGSTGLQRSLVQRRLEELPAVGAAGEASVAASGGAARPGAVGIPATEKWTPSGLLVIEGKCYHVVARGTWTDSRGAQCGADGVCPPALLSDLGPPPMSKEERESYYLGQHPRSALVGRVGEGKTFYVGADCTFLAPASGPLAFRMRDGDDPSAVRAGRLDVSVTEVSPVFADAAGNVKIQARIDDVDMLHFTPAGIFWEWSGSWSRVGENDGHYPTVINGILWWPKWTERLRSEVLPAAGLRSEGGVQLVSVEARRGGVRAEPAPPGETVLRFNDDGLGSSHVACVVTIKPPAAKPNAPARGTTKPSGSIFGE